MTETTETSEVKDPRLVEAEIARTLAEAAKARAEVKNLGLDRRIKEAEAEQKHYHALSAKYGAESMRIQTEATQRQEKLALATDHHYRLYRFDGPVYMDAVQDCLTQLAMWDRLDPECDITVEFDSPGGSVIAGNHLFDQIALYSKRPWDAEGTYPRGTHRTVGVIRGWAASMAGILVQAFDERVAGPNATLMIHEASSFAAGKVSEIKDEVKFLEQLDKTVTDWIMTRVEAAKLANPSIEGITRTDFENGQHRKEWYVSAKDAVRMGLVDRIG